MFALSSAKNLVDSRPTTSRVRSHKGNAPTLPQTKYCPLCPAKFTRTTHLNRHLRSHTNERLYHCNMCSAEFTRSDLLTRHKRTCGDPLHTNKSRQKSCQACAESKIKCNLQQPCSKCLSRGRECVFINDPQVSRTKKYGRTGPSAVKNTPSETEGDSSPGPCDFESPTTSVAEVHIHAAYPNTANRFGSPGPHHSTLSVADQPAMSPPGFVTLADSSPSSSNSPCHSSPQSDFAETPQDSMSTFDSDTLAFDAHLNHLLLNTSFDPFLDQYLNPGSSQSFYHHDIPWADIDATYSSSTTSDHPTFSQSRLYSDSQQFTAAADYPATLIPSLKAVSVPAASLMPVQVASVQPNHAEGEHYLYLFFSAFSAQIPLLHRPTWTSEDKPPILIRAMQACGALFVKTRTATNFITETLAITRDILLQDFARNTADLANQHYLILAVVLLQTIGLFHQKSDQRVSSNVYHGMLVTMIRRAGIINRIGSWAYDSPEPGDSSSLDATWRQWAHYETTKRALLLSYLHDCCHCMYFSLLPSFRPAELNICLPCDDDLFNASSAQEWYEMIQSPSPYGTGEARITGVSMQQALSAMDEKRMITTPLLLNPFAHFILIHTILRNLYAPRAEYASHDDPLSHCPSGFYKGDDTDMNDGSEKKTDPFATQYALHNWLQMWMNGPESTRLEKSTDEPSFICNPLPFYWLAQVSLLAIQESGSFKSAVPDSEFRFRLMKEWLDRIRSFLHSGEKIPSRLWDELMSIRLQISQVRAPGDKSDVVDGLLAFFPEH